MYAEPLERETGEKNRQRPKAGVSGGIHTGCHNRTSDLACDIPNICIIVPC